MNRASWLQERRMEKFVDILDRGEEKRLCYGEAAEILGMSGRTFRRYRKRYEDSGLDGLGDRRLGKASPRAVPADERGWMMDRYRTHYMGWTAKHFHDHLVKHHNFNRATRGPRPGFSVRT